MGVTYLENVEIWNPKEVKTSSATLNLHNTLSVGVSVSLPNPRYHFQTNKFILSQSYTIFYPECFVKTAELMLFLMYMCNLYCTKYIDSKKEIKFCHKLTDIFFNFRTEFRLHMHFNGYEMNWNLSHWTKCTVTLSLIKIYI